MIKKQKNLQKKFVENFKKFDDQANEETLKAAPVID
jgi:ATP-dependent phosphoenolpyruvate carboxykinase